MTEPFNDLDWLIPAMPEKLPVFKEKHHKGRLVRWSCGENIINGLFNNPSPLRTHHDTPA